MAAAVAVLAPAVAGGGGGGGGVVRHGGADKDGRDGQHGVSGLRREADLIPCIQKIQIRIHPPAIRLLAPLA